MKKKILGIVMLVMLMISQAVSAAPLAYDSGSVNQLVYDNFDDNAIDTSIWSAGQEGGPTAAEINQRLEITLPADSAGQKFSAAYYSACLLHGDFDIQVDYELLTWPTTNGVRISLSTTPGDMERVSYGAQGDYAGGPEVYLADYAGFVTGVTLTSDVSGKLKLRRTGYNISGLYYANGVWNTISSHSALPNIDDTAFGLAAWSHDPIFADQQVKIAFDNLIINYGELVCSSAAAPDLAITQVADQAAVSTGDPMGFTITVTNNGDATANIVTLTNPLPIYAQFDWSIEGTDAAACLMGTDGLVSCNFQDIDPGEVKTIRLTAPEYVYYSKCFSPIITSTATLMAYNQPVNKTATANITVECPYIHIDISSDTANVPAGDPVRFTVAIGNTGYGDAKDVESFFDIQNAPGTSWAITEVIPSSASSNCVIGPYGTATSLECSFERMAPQEQVHVTVTSPTTTESCGVIGAGAGMRASNSVGYKTKPYYIIINCPVSDTTPPVITPTISGILGQNGWYTSDVSLTWSVSDPESAVSSTSGCEDVLVTLDQVSTSYTCGAMSAGGSGSQTVSIGRDASSPVITCPTGSLPPTSGQTVTAGVDAAVSGLNEPASVLSGTLGSSWPQTLSFSAIDLAGNMATKQCTFNTTYNFSGFMQPVDNPGPGPEYIFNSVKAGAAVPVKFSLGGNQGPGIFWQDYPNSQPASCTSAAGTDPIEQTVSAGGSSLSYDPITDTYTYTWKTDKRWAGTCRALNVKFIDGSQYLTYFKFK